MIRKNFVNIHKLMVEHRFHIDSDTVPENLKCVECKSVLKDARQVPCGCSFCRLCIDDMVTSGAVFCPGLSENCGETLLANSAPDYRANLNVCKLVVKCPRINCLYEGELATIEAHLQVCSRKSVKCLFHEFGCKQERLPVDEIDTHFKQENWTHSKILIEMICNINNELLGLRRTGSGSVEIEMLKLGLALKDREIKSILDEMKHVENENRTIRDEMRLMIDDMRHLKNENKLMRDEMNLIKKEKVDLALQVRILSDRMDSEIDVRCDKIEINMEDLHALLKDDLNSFKDDMRSSLDELRRDMKALKRDKSVKSDAEPVKSPEESKQVPTESYKPPTPKRVAAPQPRIDKDIDTSFVWIINDDVGKTWQCKDSEYFHGVKYPYRYQLTLTTDGFFGASLDVQLRIHPGSRDANLPWPFRGIVTMTVGDMCRSSACRRIRKKCHIQRPARCLSTCSEEFSFSRPVLRQSGVDLHRGVRVTCDIILDFG